MSRRERGVPRRPLGVSLGDWRGTFTSLSSSASRPRAPQIVVGNGGTPLGPSVTTPLPGLQVAGAQVTAGRVLRQFGYLTLEAAGAGWTATLRDTGEMPVLLCAIGNLSLSCSP